MNNYIPSAEDEMHYALFLTELANIGVAMCSALIDVPQQRALKAQADSFLVQTALRRSVFKQK